MRLRAIIGIYVLALSMVVVSCGQDEDSGGPGAGENAGATTSQEDRDRAQGDRDNGTGAGRDSRNDAIPKEAFVRRGNAICEARQQRILAEASAVFEERNVTDENRAAVEAELASSVLVPGLQAELDELRGLGVPRGDEQRVDAILSSIQQIVDRAREDPSALSGSSRPYGQAEKLADSYGLTKCPYG